MKNLFKKLFTKTYTIECSHEGIWCNLEESFLDYLPVGTDKRYYRVYKRHNGKYDPCNYYIRIEVRTTRKIFRDALKKAGKCKGIIRIK